MKIVLGKRAKKQELDGLYYRDILLTFQVLLGYVLMGALVTRFAVLFTAGGPAGVFADEREEEKSR